MPNQVPLTVTGGVMIPPVWIDRPLPAFDEDIPPDFLKRTIELLFQHYPTKGQWLRNWKATESHDAWAHVRRGLIERDWREAALACGLNGVAELNIALNAFHSVVTTNRFMITQSFVEDRKYLPRPAAFRETAARATGTLFADDGPGADAKVYTICIHGLDPDRPHLPGFCDFIFPVMEGKQILIRDRVCAFERYPELVTELRRSHLTVAEERIPDDVQPKLRDDDGAQPKLRDDKDIGG